MIGICSGRPSRSQQHAGLRCPADELIFNDHDHCSTPDDDGTGVDELSLEFETRIIASSFPKHLLGFTSGTTRTHFGVPFYKFLIFSLCMHP